MAHPKRGRAIFRYDTRENDFVFSWGNGAKSGAVLLHYFITKKHMRYDFETNAYPTPVKFDNSMIEQLEAAGYDTKTLRVVIDKKVSDGDSTAT
jgi:hypothetical protein